VLLQPEQGALNADKAIKTDHRSEAEQSLDRVERLLSTVVVGLEILTGICAGLENVEPEDVNVVEEAMEEGMSSGSGFVSSAFIPLFYVFSALLISP
jgi:hypothetical protein